MTRRDFLWLLSLIGCCDEEIIANDVNGSIMKKQILDWWSGGFNPDSYMDKINLQSNTTDLMTIGTGNRISSWRDTIGNDFAQSTDSSRPTLTAGVPLFDGGDTLIKSSDVNLGTQYSMYIVFKNTGALDKIFFGANSATDYGMHSSSGPNGFQLAIGGSTKGRWLAGHLGKRFIVLSIRRSVNTFIVKLNDRTLIQTINTFAGENTLVSRLMAYTGGFTMTGGMRAFCASSQYVSDSVNTQIVNALYSRYSLASDNAADCVVGFGDSNMTATGGGTALPVSLGTSLSLAPLQLGLSGTLFTSGTNNGNGRYSSQIITKPYTDKIVIQYGTNDVSAAVSAATYSPLFDTMISTLISSGYSPNNICICSIPYQQSGANASLLDDYQTALSNIATTYGTKYYNLLQAMRDGGGNSLLNDTVHLNSSGNSLWAAGVLTATGW